MKATEEYTLPDLDINYAAFQEMKLGQKWLNENLGYYVAEEIDVNITNSNNPHRLPN